MKRTLKALFAAFVLFSSQVFAGWSNIETSNADWSSSQFVADTTIVSQDQLYDLVVSDTIANNSTADNLDVVIKFHDIVPGSSVNGVYPSYRVFVVVEEEIATGVWNTIADNTQQPFKLFPSGAKEAKFIIQKNGSGDNGQPFNTLNGFKWFVNEAPSETLRIRIFFEELTPGGAAALQSITVTGAYRFY